MWSPRRKPKSMLGSAVAFLLALTPATAMADNQSHADASNAVSSVKASVANQGLSKAGVASRSTVTLPGQAEEGIKLRAPTGQITLRLPASGEAAPVGATNVFRGAGAENNVLTQPIANGARALVRITGPDAPVDYRFPLEGASRLEQLPDGSVLVHDLTGEPSVTIKAPWAKDANGTAVSTSYSVEGTTLVQHVAHQGAAYPVVADPSAGDTIVKIIKGCLGGALGGTTIAGIISSIDSVQNAVKFVVRRVGFLAALGCAGGIVLEFA